MNEESSNSDGLPTVFRALSPNQQQVAHYLAFSGYNYGTRLKTGAVLAAAQKFGVSRSQIYVWLKQQEFLDEIEANKSNALGVAYQGLLLAARQGSIAAMKEIFKRMAPDHEQAIRLEKLQHKQQLQRMEVQAQKGLPPSEGSVVYQIFAGEYGTPGFPMPETEAEDRN